MNAAAILQVAAFANMGWVLARKWEGVRTDACFFFATVTEYATEESGPRSV